MANKILGYVFSLVGLATIALGNFTKLQAQLPFQIPSALGGWTLTIIGVVIVGIGVFFLMGSGSSKKAKQASEEVPIYQGDKIVGYRKAK